MNWQRDFVMFCSSEWKQNYHRRQLFEALIKRAEVKRFFVIEVPADLFVALIKKPYRILDFIKTFIKAQSMNKKIFRLRPFLLLHQVIAINYSFLHSLNNKLIRYQLKRLFKKYKINQNAIFWVYSPHQIYWYDFLSQIIVVYDCYDEYALNALDKPEPKLKELEVTLMKRADIVFTTSIKLLSKAKENNNKSYLIYNATNVSYFAKAFLEKPPLPFDIADIKKPIAGYIGKIRNWIDFELLKKVIGDNQDIFFIFIGSVAENVKYQVQELAKYKNVRFLGEKPFNQLYKYLHFFEVGLIPNKKTKFNESVVPLKLFDYLAAGRKIVASNTCRDFEENFSDYIYIANTPEEFNEKLRLAIKPDREKQEKNFNKGQSQDWDNRVDLMLNYLKNLT